MLTGGKSVLHSAKNNKTRPRKTNVNLQVRRGERTSPAQTKLCPEKEPLGTVKKIGAGGSLLLTKRLTRGKPLTKTPVQKTVITAFSHQKDLNMAVHGDSLKKTSPQSQQKAPQRCSPPSPNEKIRGDTPTKNKEKKRASDQPAKREIPRQGTSPSYSYPEKSFKKRKLSRQAPRNRQRGKFLRRGGWDLLLLTNRKGGGQRGNHKQTKP